MLEIMFQSAPAIAGGRCRDTLLSQPVAETFQSAPAIAGGRCGGNGLFTAAHFCFNPRPPLLAGDAKFLDRLGVVRGVSIRARHCWRAMRIYSVREAHANEFQSAPAIAGGRCRLYQIHNRSIRSVSIRARHCWRAMPCKSWRAAQRYCFNPRPPLLAGDAACTPGAMAPILFQSAPAIAGGRCRYPATRPNPHLSFNPRPPLLAGDACLPWRV